MAALETVSRVIERLAPLIEKEVNLVLNSKKEAENLASKLKKMKDMMEAAERKQLTDPGVKHWLEELQDLAYDVEDALDEWETANRRLQLEGSEEDSQPSNLSICKKVCPFVHSLCSCFKQVIGHRHIGLEIKELNAAVDGIYDKAIFKRDKTTSIVVESKVYGRDMDKETLIKTFLLSDEGRDDQKENGTIPVISIVGAGGLGKTTLAKLVYNDKEVRGEFPVRIWVSVGDPFEEIRIAKAILEALKEPSSYVSELEELTQMIKDSITEKSKFLLVLDDVWTEDHTKWEPLKDCLSYGAKGSKILVTTRKERVARAMAATEVHPLRPLDDENCWSIISQIALFGRDEGDRRRLEIVGRKIANKCKGFPLAGRTLGSLLRDKRTVREWQLVLESEIWELRNVENDLFRHMFLSYDELEPAMKRCFSYCAVFPKGLDLNVDRLIRIWMAQGFLSSSPSADELELEGQYYFEDLAQRSFFQDLVKDEEFGERVVWCRMHDIVHDFAQFLTKNECATVDRINGDSRDKRGKEVYYQNARHIFWLSETNPETPISIFNAGKLRSFFCYHEFPPNLLYHLKCVRLLSLIGCGLENIPVEIENLIHLRYLALRANNKEKLPESICGLFNLQTLDLAYCDALSGLPEGISKLINLRHLSLEPISFKSLNPKRIRFPLGFERLNDLRTLSYVYAGKGCNNLEVDADEAKKAALEQKKAIQTLELEYHRVTLDVLEALQPPPDLQSLTCTGLMLPTWITSLNNLRKLTLTTKNADRESKSTIIRSSFLQPLGKLQSLEELSIYHRRDVVYLGCEFLGLTSVANQYGQQAVAFPALKKLKFRDCWRWREWKDISEEEANSIKIMPYLQELEIDDCPSLKALPHLLLRVAPSLQSLKIIECKLLEQRYRTGSDRDKVSHIPNLEIYPCW
ncbi:hypothetical protein Pfo_010191 [Paulownia fortunei]|nr:hypothetical protein Pfo_010191 [Paulownia fortunei]